MNGRNHNDKEPTMKTCMTIAMITLTSAALTMAQPGPREGAGAPGPRDGGRMNRGPGVERPIDKLNLTTGQQEQLRELRREAATNLRPLQDALRAARETTRSLMAAPTIDRDEVMKSVQAEGEAYLALSKARVKHQLDVREIVGPEKAGMLIELRDEWQRGPGKGARPE
jgi:Spy/CpxP family protein refolding chaperone